MDVATAAVPRTVVEGSPVGSEMDGGSSLEDQDQEAGTGASSWIAGQSENLTGPLSSHPRVSVARQESHTLSAPPHYCDDFH